MRLSQKFALAIGLLGLLFCSQLHGQEQYIRACATSYACQLTPPGGTPWSAGVQTYVFTPMSPDVSLRINVHNQNTTNAHTAQTLTLWITSSTTANFSLINNADRWVQAAVIQNTTVNAQCTAVAANNSTTPGASGQGTCYAQGMYAAQIAIQFTPGGAQAGTVDNFDIDVVQCTSTHCNYPGGPQPGADNTAGGGLFSGQTPANFVLVNGRDAFSNNAMPTAGANTATTFGTAPLPEANYLFNNATWDRARSQSQGNAGVSGVLDTVLPGMSVVTAPATWNATNQGTQAQCSASVAASATGKKHVITGCTVCVSAGATPQTPIFANLRDGASGAGTIKWAGALGSATNGFACVQFNGFSSGLILGTANTAATCELSAASAATVACTANIQGYDQ